MARAPIKFITSTETATKPELIFPLSVGLHLFSSETKSIASGTRAFLETGVSLELPTGYYAQVVGRYSMTSIGIYVGSLTFESSYTGTIKVLMDNKSRYELPIQIGDKIAELIILPLDPPLVTYQNLLDDSTINFDLLDPLIFSGLEGENSI